jgi:tRNA threonylcarbamoyladenosine biosynthesis protein TsaE
MGKVLNIVSHSEQQTFELAAKLAGTYFSSGDVLVLTGELGAGKTVFVRGLAKGLGLDENLVSSPSFTFVNEYPGSKPLYHIDLYRLHDLAELREIGWHEYLSRDGIVVIEWGEKAREMLPARYYQLNFHIVDEHQRQINISFVGND